MSILILVAPGREGADGEQSAWWHDAVAGFGAEMCANVFWTPLDVVKQRLQACLFRTLRRPLIALSMAGGPCGYHSRLRGPKGSPPACQHFSMSV